jgi:uncharacterized protein (TIGR00369 family)
MSERKGVFWDAVEGRIPPPPSAQLLGWKLIEIDPDKGRIKVEFEATPQFINPVGNIQGGFLAAMLDDTLGPALVSTLPADEFAPTLELKVNFVRPAKVGPLFAEGRVVHKGKSIAFLEGELRNIQGKIIATATATVQIQKIRSSEG